uniref:Uncharacterized protein n=1 Tax=Sphaerodactylus townsendi TaxID=933632 RepID=A0ACB8FUP1_9SAUR
MQEGDTFGGGDLPLPLILPSDAINFFAAKTVKLAFKKIPILIFVYFKGFSQDPVELCIASIPTVYFEKLVTGICGKSFNALTSWKSILTMFCSFCKGWWAVGIDGSV